jgi:hypothetical protein
VKNLIAAAAMIALLGPASLSAQSADMTFFITSAGSGNGADLGGLEGADRHCQDLAYAVGFGDVTWRAYLSTVSMGGEAAVNARDRIGDGPWHNYEGDLIARNVADLHSDDANLTKETTLTEKGAMQNGRGDQPNQHDLLTGSSLDGSAYSTAEPIDMRDGTSVEYTACDNWTSSGRGATRVGHHDRQGGGENPTSWNSAHNSRGCSQANLQATGGNGYFFCFSTDGQRQQALREE